eukprot:1555972-Prorocentrum_lima.AAC.1
MPPNGNEKSVCMSVYRSPFLLFSACPSVSLSLCLFRESPRMGRRKTSARHKAAYPASRSVL